MAAVRIAARRLTGQQPQAIFRSAIANEQGVLNRGAYVRWFSSSEASARRFSSSEASAANGPRINNEHPSVSGAACDERKHFSSRLVTLGQKKEELYDLLAEIQRSKHFADLSLYTRRKNRRLLQRLTAHIDPRPTNPEWRRYERQHTFNVCLASTAGLFAFLYVTELWSSLSGQNKQVQGADSTSKASVSCAEPNIEE